MRLLLIYLLLIPVLGLAQTVDSNYVQGKVYVKFKDAVIIPGAGSGTSVNKAGELPFIQALLGNKAITKAEKPFFTPNSQRLGRIYKIELLQSENIQEILKKLNQDPNVEYAERIPVDRTFYEPNDYSSLNQYSLDIINAVQAWDVTRGDPSILVAVVDDAVQTNHVDLSANIGQVGYDVASNDNNPNPPNTAYSHGTHVAGIVSARTDNGIGISSLGFNIKIMPIKAADGTSDSEGRILITHGYPGIMWAADNGARIINMSWGGPGYSNSGQEVINYAVNKGCVLIAAAGNSNTSTKHYPAAYENVISVASTTSSDTRSSFSNFGSWVDISAPGSSIKSTVPFNSYAIYDGTSMASPLVASLAGLMLSVNPTMTAGQVEAGLKATADNINSQNPFYIGSLGAGRINAYKAVKWSETVYSTANGSWTSSANWTYQVPSEYTNPTVQSGHTITVPAATYQVKNTLNINGVLDLSTTNSTINIKNN